MSRPHRRRNPLTGEWVLVSPQRAERPWQGQIEPSSAASAPAYDPACYLCPGNARAGGVRNPRYESTFAFDNDFPALLPDAPTANLDDRNLLTAATERGVCRVMCFSPRHDLSIPQMDPAALAQVVEAWREETATLSGLSFVRYVQIFENRGALMGASNPHPHCQIWASESIPTEVEKEREHQADYFGYNDSCLLCDYSALETGGERAVCENESFLALVPFWAVWPFEILIVSKRHFAGLRDMDALECGALAEILQKVTRRYDALFGAPFPYSMGLHQAPAGPHLSEHGGAWHFHAHFYPPLLRSASIRKFMVGYELLASPQRDLTPEAAAARLRDLPD